MDSRVHHSPRRPLQQTPPAPPPHHDVKPRPIRPRPIRPSIHLPDCQMTVAAKQIDCSSWMTRATDDASSINTADITTATLHCGRTVVPSEWRLVRKDSIWRFQPALQWVIVLHHRVCSHNDARPSRRPTVSGYLKCCGVQTPDLRTTCGLNMSVDAMSHQGAGGGYHRRPHIAAVSPAG